MAGYKCTKCGNNDCEVGEFRAVRGVWTKILNMQTEKFTTITCTMCSYTEIYKGSKASLGENFIDLIIN